MTSPSTFSCVTIAITLTLDLEITRTSRLTIVSVSGGFVHSVAMDPEQRPNDTRTGLICSRLFLVLPAMESTLHLLLSRARA
jgi:hypothetical protein